MKRADPRRPARKPRRDQRATSPRLRNPTLHRLLILRIVDHEKPNQRSAELLQRTLGTLRLLQRLSKLRVHHVTDSRKFRLQPPTPIHPEHLRIAPPELLNVLASQRSL